jgi:gliding motility-associated-like protein
VNENCEISEVIQVIDIDYQIITEKNTQHTFLFSTSNQNLLFDWYIDDALIAKNTNKCQLTEKQVGKHVVKTIPKNTPCIKPKSTTFQIKSSGSIKFFNVFTPNGDGTNDKYLVEINNYENYQILIYDQVKNQLVFTSDDPENPWNGSLYNQGENCPPGEYIAKIKYTLNGEKIQTKNIKFTLIRS